VSVAVNLWPIDAMKWPKVFAKARLALELYRKDSASLAGECDACLEQQLPELSDHCNYLLHDVLYMG
jgi:hypothetical protein